MLMPFAEPTAPRYIYINPETNQVHLLVPVVGGQEISTDNTCKSTVAMDEFFLQGAALRELNAYKAALEFDLQFIEDGDPLKEPKQARLTQINAYIAAIPAMQRRYKDAITSLLQTPSNFHSIQLRPKELDNQSRVINPVFSLNRGVDGTTGTSLSSLYNAMYQALPNATIAPIDPRSKLNDAVMTSLPEQAGFETIQQALTEQCKALLGIDVDFTSADMVDPSDRYKKIKVTVDKVFMDNIMGNSDEDPATSLEYTNALLNTCAPNLWFNLPVSPFYSEQGNTDRTERLSIATQFFLAHVNAYLAANGNSRKNFGAILDASSDLSDEVAAIVVGALGSGADVEHSLCAFMNEHADEFELARTLTEVDIQQIKDNFTRNYNTVTATKENPHMDDFMILDTQAQAGKFVMYQGSICVDYSELADPSLSNTWAQHHYELSGTNEHIKASVDLDIEKLVSSINDEQLEKLPIKISLECMKSPAFQLRTFLHDVAKGKQDEVEKLLADNPERAQELLSTPGTFTDYSGRTFNCTAYEYAYWAKDTHMCRMLEAHMDENTKAAMLVKVTSIDTVGLTYEQHGHVVEHSKHFDMTPLKTALQNYVNGYDEWDAANNYDAMKAAWMLVGLAQRDLPVHVINEYCRPDRSFDPLPAFNEDKLPRILTYNHFNMGSDVPLFPLVVSGSSGLGVDFALIRGAGRARRHGQSAAGYVPGGGSRDLAAVSRLDEVRTADLTLSRTNLGLIEPELDHGARLSL